MSEASKARGEPDARGHSGRKTAAGRLIAGIISAMLGNELHALAAELRNLARTEIAYQSARAGLAGKYLRRLLGLGLLALGLAFLTIMALVMGALLALATSLGPWGAMAAVVLGLTVVTLLIVLATRMAWRRLRRLFANQGG